MANRRTFRSTGLLLLLAGLIISLIVNFYLLSRGQSSQPEVPVPQSFEPVPGYGIRAISDDQATADVIAFRTLMSNDTAQGSFGIYVTPEELREYLDSVYPKLVEAEIEYMKEQSRDWSAYHWRVGCYWMLAKDRDGVSKTDLCFVPTLVNKKNKYDALDYFVVDSAFYDHDVTIPGRGNARPGDPPRGGPVYNTATMFP